jgi:hypothetical protein
MPSAENQHGSCLTPSAAPRPAARPWARRHVRLLGLFVALPAAAVLATAAAIHPDARGYDTHTQLGLPPCGLLQMTGMPCPTCGMTTAFALMACGRVWAALQTQACGALLFVLTLAAALAGAVQALSGRDILHRLRFKMWWLWALLAAVTAGWALKMGLGIYLGQLPVR